MKLLLENLEIDLGLKSFNANLELSTNSINCLTGNNGSGKTSLFNYLKVNKEYFFLEKKNISTSFLSQLPLLPFGEVRVIDILNNLNSFYKNTNNPFEIDEELLIDFKLDKLLNHSVNSLSGGENQKVKILISLSFNTDFYLMDEASSFLDENSKNVLWKKIKEKNKIEQKGFLLFEPDKNNIVLNIDNLIDIEKIKSIK